MIPQIDLRVRLSILLRPRSSIRSLGEFFLLCTAVSGAGRPAAPLVVGRGGEFSNSKRRKSLTERRVMGRTVGCCGERRSKRESPACKKEIKVRCGGQLGG